MCLIVSFRISSIEEQEKKELCVSLHTLSSHPWAPPFLAFEHAYESIAELSFAFHIIFILLASSSSPRPLNLALWLSASDRIAAISTPCLLSSILPFSCSSRPHRASASATTHSISPTLHLESWLLAYITNLEDGITLMGTTRTLRGGNCSQHHSPIKVSGCPLVGEWASILLT